MHTTVQACVLADSCPIPLSVLISHAGLSKQTCGGGGGGGGSGPAMVMGNLMVASPYPFHGTRQMVVRRCGAMMTMTMIVMVMVMVMVGRMMMMMIMILMMMMMMYHHKNAK